MRHAGDGKTFIVSAAILMAGLVITTMLAINASLEQALSPLTAGHPVPVQISSPSPAPHLQVVTSPSVTLPSPAAPSPLPSLAPPLPAVAPALVAANAIKRASIPPTTLVSQAMAAPPALRVVPAVTMTATPAPTPKPTPSVALTQTATPAADNDCDSKKDSDDKAEQKSKKKNDPVMSLVEAANGASQTVLGSSEPGDPRDSSHKHQCKAQDDGHSKDKDKDKSSSDS